MTQPTTESIPFGPVGPGCWRLRVWVQPGAKADETAGTYQGSLKVRLNAPAVDNKANRALLNYLCDRLGLKPRQLSLDTGRASRRKTLLIRSETEPDWGRLLPGRAEPSGTS